MYKVNQKTAPNIFLSRSQRPSHSYPTLLDSRNLTKYNQSKIFKRLYTQFQLEDHKSGIAFLALNRNDYYA